MLYFKEIVRLEFDEIMLIKLMCHLCVINITVSSLEY